MHRIIRLSAGALLLLILSPCLVSADTESGLHQYTTESPDKKYLFVMLKGGDRDNPELLKSDKYPASGLYRNDGSNTPLWTVDWSGYVILSSDGVHAIRKGPWPRESDGNCGEAITFLAYGQPIKSYRICDLVLVPWLLPHSSSHFEWQRMIAPEQSSYISTITSLAGGSFSHNEGVVLDEGRQTLRVATLQGDQYIFDIRTGEIIESKRPFLKTLLALAALLGLGYVFYLSRSVRREVDSPPGIRLMSLAKISAITFVVLVALMGAIHQLNNHSRDNAFLGAAWRALIYLPLRMFERMGGGTVTDGALEIGISTVFWCVIIAMALFLNRALLRTIRYMRRRRS